MCVFMLDEAIRTLQVAMCDTSSCFLWKYPVSRFIDFQQVKHTPSQPQEEPVPYSVGAGCGKTSPRLSHHPSLISSCYRYTASRGVSRRFLRILQLTAERWTSSLHIHIRNRYEYVRVFFAMYVAFSPRCHWWWTWYPLLAQCHPYS